MSLGALPRSGDGGRHEEAPRCGSCGRAGGVGSAGLDRGRGAAGVATGSAALQPLGWPAGALGRRHHTLPCRTLLMTQPVLEVVRVPCACSWAHYGGAAAKGGRYWGGGGGGPQGAAAPESGDTAGVSRVFGRALAGVPGWGEAERTTPMSRRGWGADGLSCQETLRVCVSSGSRTNALLLRTRALEARRHSRVSL